jgi:hypothetical protein
MAFIVSFAFSSKFVSVTSAEITEVTVLYLFGECCKLRIYFKPLRVAATNTFYGFVPSPSVIFLGLGFWYLLVLVRGFGYWVKRPPQQM